MNDKVLQLEKKQNGKRLIDYINKKIIPFRFLTRKNWQKKRIELYELFRHARVCCLRFPHVLLH